MIKEYAAGAVLYRNAMGTTLFLLVYSGRNKVWGFPKGHLEAGESEETAARREIGEEVGVTDLRLSKDFREEIVYQATSNRPPSQGRLIEKHVVYLLGETKTVDIAIDRNEITAHAWLTAAEAEERLTFADLKRILKTASEHLGNATDERA